MVQRYLPEVRDGDKRIILVDANSPAPINRVPAPDETLSNCMSAGGGAHEPDQARQGILRGLGPDLKKAV